MSSLIAARHARLIDEQVEDEERQHRQGEGRADQAQDPLQKAEGDGRRVEVRDRVVDRIEDALDRRDEPVRRICLDRRRAAPVSRR